MVKILDEQKQIDKIIANSKTRLKLTMTAPFNKVSSEGAEFIAKCIMDAINMTFNDFKKED